jgi:hypothetical protein
MSRTNLILCIFRQLSNNIVYRGSGRMGEGNNFEKKLINRLGE